jgi:hypothetical protein
VQYFDCWADGVATNILMPHYNCRDAQQSQQCQRMRYQPSACATASLNPVKLISYLQVCVFVSCVCRTPGAPPDALSRDFSSHLSAINGKRRSSLRTAVVCCPTGLITAAAAPLHPPFAQATLPEPRRLLEQPEGSESADLPRLWVVKPSAID